MQCVQFFVLPIYYCAALCYKTQNREPDLKKHKISYRLIPVLHRLPKKDLSTFILTLILSTDFRLCTCLRRTKLTRHPITFPTAYRVHCAGNKQSPNRSIHWTAKLVLSKKYMLSSEPAHFLKLMSKGPFVIIVAINGTQ